MMIDDQEKHEITEYEQDCIESQKPKLNEREDKFITEYLLLGKASEAARNAGYSMKSASRISRRLMTSPKIQREIVRRRTEETKKLGINKESILQELVNQVFLDFDVIEIARGITAGEYDPDDLSPEQKRLIKRITMLHNPSGTRSVSIELYDKQKALELLGQNLALFAKQDKNTKGMMMNFNMNVPKGMKIATQSANKGDIECRTINIVEEGQEVDND